MIVSSGKDRTSGLTASALWQRRRFLLILMAGSLLAAGVLLLVIPPVYTGESLVALTVHHGEVFERQVSAPTPPTNGEVQTAMEVLRSRDLAAQVVDQLSLTRDPEFNSSLRPLPAPLQAVAAWAADLRDRLPEVLVPKRAGAGGDIRGKVVDAVMKGLTVRSDNESYAIHVSFRAHAPDKAARLANAFADLYVVGLLRNRFDDLERATNWVDKQIATLQGQVNDATRDAALFRERNRLAPLAADPGLMESQQMVALDTELGQAAQLRADAEVKLHEAQSWLKTSKDLPPVDLVAQSPFIQSLRAQEAVVLARLAEMQAHYQDNHPAVVSLRAQLDSLRRDIAGEVQKVVQNLSSQLTEARSRETVLKQRMDTIATNANQQSRPLTEMAQQQRDIDIKTGMLQTFMTRYAEIANRTDIEQPDARVVSHAMPATAPSHPQPLIFLGIALFGSLGLGVALVSLLERFRPGYLTTHQLKTELGLPTLGVVPELRRLPSRLRPSDYMLQKPTSVYAEAIKSAQLAILDARPDGETKRILVASSVPGEGKTAFAISLARSLATSGYRTLLLDCDFRRPAVGRQFGIGVGATGLVDFLREDAELDTVIRQDEPTGLYYIPAGRRCDDPQRLLDSTIGASLLTGLTNRFEVVIIDSPPTMVASDGAVLAKASDLVLYVVAWDKTPRGAVQAGVDYLQVHGAKVAGIILSKVDFDRSGQHGDYVDYAFRYHEYYLK